MLSFVILLKTVCIQGTLMETNSPGASLRKMTHWSGTTVKLENALKVKTITTHTQTQEDSGPPTLFLLFCFSAPPSFNHATRQCTRTNSSQAGLLCCPVLWVWAAAAQPLSQDLRGEEVSSWGSSLAGFPADQVQRLHWPLQPHLWRRPYWVLLGAHCSTLHVGCICVIRTVEFWFVHWTLTFNSLGGGFVCLEKAEWKCRWCWGEWT